MNAAMYVPITLFAGLLFRNLLTVALGATLLSAATEVVQALVGLGRACDSDDFVANTGGAVAGTCLAALAVTILRQRASASDRDPHPHPHHRSPRRVLGMPVPLFAVVTGFVVVTLVWAGWVDRALRGVDGTFPVSSRQRAAAERITHDLLGPDTRIDNVQYVKDGTGGPDLLWVSTQDNSLQITWPQGQVASLSDNKPIQPVPPDKRLPPAEAANRAVDYMRRNFPWAANATPAVTPAGAEGDQQVSWSSTVDGVLMPMRLAIVVDAAGRVATLTARNIPNPPLPPVSVSEAAAAETAATNARSGTVP
ncbi:hypothetical protein GT354_16860, partial [Streptomyces sp. SID3343]|nr:hypothetical protein [Streptomyces sp. SID3343]